MLSVSWAKVGRNESILVIEKKEYIFYPGYIWEGVTESILGRGREKLLTIYWIEVRKSQLTPV